MEEIIWLQQVKPYLDCKGNIHEDDYNALFGRLPMDTRIKILGCLYEYNIKVTNIRLNENNERKNIEIVSNKEVKNKEVKNKIKNTYGYERKNDKSNCERSSKILENSSKLDVKKMIDIAKGKINKNRELWKEDFAEIFSECSEVDQLKALKMLKEQNIKIIFNRKKGKKIDEKRNVNKCLIRKNKFMMNLTNEQLCKIYQEGNEEALEVLITKNSGLVYSRIDKFINKYKHKLDDDDLVQAGYMGMMKAAEKFDIKNGAKFSTYAIIWIEQSINRVIADEGFTIRIPVHVFDTINKVTNIMRNNPILNKEDIYQLLNEEGFSREKFEEILRLQKEVLNVSSINKTIGEDCNTEILDLLPEECEYSLEDEVMHLLLKKDINIKLESLTKREKEIIEMRFGLNGNIPNTLEETGKKFKVTRERIRQIESQAMKRLRHPSRQKGLKEYLRR